MGDFLIDQKRPLPDEKAKGDPSNSGSFADKVESCEVLDMLDEHIFEDTQINLEQMEGNSETGNAIPSTSIELQKNEDLDRSLQLEMIDKVQTPMYASMNFKRKTLPTFSLKQVQCSIFSP